MSEIGLDIELLSNDVLLKAHRSFLAIEWRESTAPKPLSKRETWEGLAGINSKGKALGQLIEQLIEQELVQAEDLRIVIPYQSLPKLEAEGIEFFENLVSWAPFSISLSAEGFIGSKDFSFAYRFFLGRQQVFVERYGAFVRRSRSNFRLAPKTFELLESLDRFNSLTALEKTKEAALVVLAEIKSILNGIELDNYLQSEEVMLPQKVQIDVSFDTAGLLSLVPRFEGVPDREMERAFLQFSEVQPVYDLSLPNNRRLRVVLSEKIISVLRDIQKVRHVGGETKERILADVMSCLSDGTDRNVVDLSVFGPRVRGIGDPPLRARIFLSRLSRDWGDSASLGDANVSCGIRIEVNDEERIIPLTKEQEIVELVHVVQEAVKEGKSTIDYKGHKILIDDVLTGGLDEIQQVVTGIIMPFSGKASPTTSLKKSKYLLIYANEEASEYQEGGLVETLPTYSGEVVLPRALRKTFRDQIGIEQPLILKEHQKRGICWLQNLFRNRDIRRGCLLADDMGLGKTLQILTFLAWCVEDGYSDALGASTGPWEPILIVAPLILLENWKEEAERYFANDVFEPLLVLHDKGLRRFLIPAEKGREIQLGVPRLDVAALREHRIIITNYDTIKNYQHSFGRIPWSIIVTDEAQEFKEQNARSDALKALKAVFKIVSTGTPVENRLLDLWNLVDYFQPGTLLGSSKDFSTRYERDLDELTEEQRGALTSELRGCLRYDHQDAFILRREKEQELTDLPRKIEKRIESPLTVEQREFHVQLIKHLRESKDQAHHLSLLSSLKKLYMHPSLLEGLKPIDDPNVYIKASNKLQSVISIIEEVKKAGEKALIFADFQAMQVILAEVLGAYFNLKIDVINGAADSERFVQRENRKQTIADFSSKKGFNLIVLSPRVAGVGLTITAANHVIHYSRWWNPAKEAQATDRAYRIGQRKDVIVYYPISVDPLKQFKSFDEKLDSLLSEKKKVARDFLVPSNRGVVSEQEIIDSFGDEPPTKISTAPVARFNSVDSTRGFSGHQFEALIATLFARQGYSIVLTPLAGDMGVDLIAINLKELILVQCKYSGGIQVGSDAIRDLIDGVEYYRAKLFSSNLKKRNPALVAFTNARFDGDAKASAKRDEIELKEAAQVSELLRKFHVGPVDLLDIEKTRCRNLEAVREALSSA